MYVCVCKAVTDGQIRQAVAAGSVSVKDIKSRLGVIESCGKCASTVRQLVGECSECETQCENDFLAARGADF